jgi:hypothetical protein
MSIGNPDFPKSERSRGEPTDLPQPHRAKRAVHLTNSQIGGAQGTRRPLLGVWGQTPPKIGKPSLQKHQSAVLNPN